MNHTRLPVTGSPTRLSTSGQQSYLGWSCKVLVSFHHTNLMVLLMYCIYKVIIIIIIIIIIITTTTTTTTTTFMQGIYTYIPERQTMSLGNTVLQLFCCYYSWCLYR